LKKIDLLIKDLTNISSQLKENKNPSPTIFDDKIARLDKMQKDCKLDEIEKAEWSGGKDRIFESSYSGEPVFSREFDEISLKD
jgi:hypothetical protein